MCFSPEAVNVPHETLSSGQLWEIVSQTLADSKRRVTEEQEKALKKALTAFPSPLYARVLAKECCSWPSYMTAPTLASNVVAFFDDKLQVLDLPAAM